MHENNTNILGDGKIIWSIGYVNAIKKTPDSKSTLAKIVGKKLLIQIGDLSCKKYSSIYRGIYIIRDGDRKQRFIRSGNPF